MRVPAWWVPRSSGKRGAAPCLARVASGVSPDVEGGILPPGPLPPVESVSPTAALLPPGRMPGHTAGETPAATALSIAACAFVLANLFFVGPRALGQTADSLSSPTALKKLSLEDLMHLEVTTVSRRAEKLTEAASAIQVITREDIRLSGATSIPEALRLAPNLQVAQIDSRQWAISSRGFNNTTANKLLVLIDGRAVYTPLYAGVFWDVQDIFLPDIDRIEVISGPGGALWGANAVNGVINIISRSAKETHGLVIEGGGGSELREFGGIRYGSALTPELHLRVYGKGFDRDSSVLPDGAAATNQWHMGQGGFRLDWDATNNNLLTLQGDLYGGAIVQAATNDTTVAGGNVLGRWSHTFSERSDLQAQAYYDETFRRIPGVLREDLRTYDVDLQHRLAVGERNELIWGLGYRLLRDDVANGTGLAFLPARKTLHVYSAFVQDEIIAITDRLRLTLGSKFEHNDYTGFEFQPSGRLAWTPTAQQTVWGAVSRAVRTPSRIDRDFFFPAAPPFVLVGGANFVSEELLAYELGYRFQPHQRLSISLAGFYNDYDHVRSLRPGPPFMIANDLRAETYGLELSGSWQVTDWWRLRPGYSFLHKRLFLRAGGSDINNGTGEGNDPKHQFSIWSSMDLPGRLQLEGGLRYVDRLPSPAVPGYAELDVRLGWRAMKTLELAVVGQNLLHNHHPEFGAPAARQEIQRGVYGKVTWTF